MRPEYMLVDQIAAVEAVIGEIRQYTEPHTEADKKMLGVMASIAKDLRSRIPENIGKTRVAIHQRINLANSKRDASHNHLNGYQEKHLIGIAEELIGRWPTVRQALEKFEQETADV